MSRLNETIEETTKRFLSKIKKNKNGCWLWIAGAGRYGVFSIKHKSYQAHRVSFYLFNGEIDYKLVIDHLCRNTLCVNPKHLEAVTCRENLMRGNTQARSKSLQTHCKYDHILDGDNLTIRKDGTRHCKKCDVSAHKKFRLKRLGMSKEEYAPLQEA